MAFKVHPIAKYNYKFDARLGAAGGLQLWGSCNKLLEVNFVDDNAAVPPPAIQPDLNSATVWFKRSAVSGLIDMLRNESPVSVTINDQPPGFVFIHTGLEAVGEGELKIAA